MATSGGVFWWLVRISTINEVLLTSDMILSRRTDVFAPLYGLSVSANSSRVRHEDRAFLSFSFRLLVGGDLALPLSLHGLLQNVRILQVREAVVRREDEMLCVRSVSSVRQHQSRVLSVRVPERWNKSSSGQSHNVYR